MNKLLILADLHFDTWIRNNPEPEWRMRKQPLMLAKRVVEELKKNDTNQLIILGDLINKYAALAKVVSILQDFVEEIIKGYPEVEIKYILGNHDRTNNWDHSKESSLVSVAFRKYPNIKYMNNIYEELNKTSVYYSNYCQKILYPEKKVNVWLSHLTFGFTEIDGSKADLIVAGDIHKEWDEGNMHSVGTPWQLQADQPEEGFMGIITLDGANSKFERIPSESDEIKFVRIPKVNRNLQESTVVNRIDISNTIEEEVKKAGLEKVHALVDRNNAPSPINFNFTLKRLIIENYRSIKQMDIDFSDMGNIIYIQGPNGSGKSSIFMAIQDVLMNRGAKVNKKFNRRTQGDLNLELFLDYEGSEYHIVKGVNGVKFSKDGTEIQLRQKDTQIELEKHLPWVPYFNYFYHKANSNYWEVNDRRELMKVLFNFKAFDYYANAGKSLKRDNEKERDNMNVEIEKCKSVDDELRKLLEDKKSEMLRIQPWDKEFLDSQMKLIQRIESDTRRVNNSLTNDKARLSALESEEIPNIDKDKINTRITEIESIIEKESEKRGKITLANTKIDNAKRTIEDMKKKVIICEKCGNKIGFNEKDFEKYNGIIKENEDIIKELESGEEINTAMLIVEKNRLKSELEKTDKALVIKTEIDVLKKQIANNEEEQKQIQLGVNKILKDNNKEDMESFKKFIEIKTQENIRYDSLKSDILGIRERIELNNKKLEENTKKLEECKKSLLELNRYINLFDLRSSTSIPITHLNSFVQSMNSENLKFTAINEAGDLDIECYYKVDNEWLEYEALSSGQRALVDVQLILHMSNGAGTVLMDEPFANMDPSKIELALGIIQDANVNKLFLTSHQDINNIFDSKISLQLVNGVTEQV